MDTLLSHKVYGPKARAYLANRYVGDALEGYDALKAYQKAEDKRACFTNLVKTYCVKDAPKQLNVSSALMDKLTDVSSALMDKPTEFDRNDAAQLDELAGRLLEEVRRTVLTAFAGSGSASSEDDMGPEILKDCMRAVDSERRRRNESVRGKLAAFFEKRTKDKPDTDRKGP